MATQTTLLSSSPNPEQKKSPILGFFNLILNLRNFSLFWLGQSVSEIGTRLTGFGLSIWVYQTTHAVTQVSVVLFVTTLPGVLITPFIGALVDRWNRRWIIFFSDFGAALITAVLVLLLMNNQLQLWHTYVCAFLTSLCGSFQMLAKGAALPMLVRKEQLGQVNGLMQFSSAVSRICAPAIAGFLIASVQLQGLLWVDLGSDVIGLLTLLFVSIPQPEQSENQDSTRKSIFSEIAEGWRVISSQFTLMILIAFISLHCFVDGMTNVLINPLILSFSSTQVLGNVLSIGGIGMVVGSILMSLWGGKSNIFSFLMIWSVINGIGLIIAGIKPDVTVIASGMFLWFLTLPIVFGINQVIWQSYVNNNFQGRVLSLVGTLTGFTGALGTISASPLADVLLEPMLMENGRLASTIGRLFETGHGRGIGLLISLQGCLILLVSIGLYCYIRSMRLEEGLLLVDDSSQSSTNEQSSQSTVQ